VIFVIALENFRFPSCAAPHKRELSPNGIVFLEALMVLGRLPVLLVFVGVYGCSGSSGSAPGSAGAPSATAITTTPTFDAAQLLDHIKVLSSESTRRLRRSS